MTYPKCELCGHQFHGLPCAATSSCGCVGAFDDDYWKDGPQ